MGKDHEILEKIKKEFFKELFNLNCANYSSLVWHHQSGAVPSDKISKCGNIKEAFDEIKNCKCIPIPKDFHNMIHRYSAYPIYMGVLFQNSKFNKIARKEILSYYGFSNIRHNQYSTVIDHDNLICKGGCAFEFSKGPIAKQKFCSNISVTCPSGDTWEDLFKVLDIL